MILSYKFEFLLSISSRVVITLTDNLPVDSKSNAFNKTVARVRTISPETHVRRLQATAGVLMAIAGTISAVYAVRKAFTRDNSKKSN